MRKLEDDVIRGLAADRKNINLTLHALERLRERKIEFSDVQNVLLHGEIIETISERLSLSKLSEIGDVRSRSCFACMLWRWG